MAGRGGREADAQANPPGRARQRSERRRRRSVQMVGGYRTSWSGPGRHRMAQVGCARPDEGWVSGGRSPRTRSRRRRRRDRPRPRRRPRRPRGRRHPRGRPAGGQRAEAMLGRRVQFLFKRGEVGVGRSTSTSERPSSVWPWLGRAPWRDPSCVCRAAPLTSKPRGVAPGPTRSRSGSGKCAFVGTRYLVRAPRGHSLSPSGRGVFGDSSPTPGSAGYCCLWGYHPRGWCHGCHGVP